MSNKLTIVHIALFLIVVALAFISGRLDRIANNTDALNDMRAIQSEFRDAQNVFNCYTFNKVGDKLDKDAYYSCLYN